METHFRLWTVDCGLWTQPTGAAGFEQVERADDVGGDEVARTGNGTVHVRFRREMHDMGDGVLFDDPHHSGFITQIHLLKNIFRVLGNLFQIFQVPGISKAIQIDEFGDLRTVNDVMDEIGADEAGAAGD